MRYINLRLTYLLTYVWADLEQHIIGRAINEWQNDCGAVLMPKYRIRIRVVTFDTAKHILIPIKTLFV